MPESGLSRPFLLFGAEGAEDSWDRNWPHLTGWRRWLVVAGAVHTSFTGRAVCAAFTAAMRRYGVPAEVLTDNGAQFTGRHIKPQPVEVLFERICRENGIKQRRTKPGSPTTTGKIERLHRTLREEFLDHVAPFESQAAAQAAIDSWVESYNHRRPHQALDMATPASLFRPNGPTRLDVGTAGGTDAGGICGTWPCGALDRPARHQPSLRCGAAMGPPSRPKAGLWRSSGP